MIETWIKRLDRRASRHGVMLRASLAVDVASLIESTNWNKPKSSYRLIHFWKTIKAPTTEILLHKKEWARAIVKDNYSG